MSSTVTLYTTTLQPLETYREGIVYYWTDHARKAGLPALRLRLIRRVGEKQGKHGKEKYDVWLLTSVLSSQRLPAERAGLWYRWRWKTKVLPKLQTNLEHGETAKPERGVDSPGGGGILVGDPVVAGHDGRVAPRGVRGQSQPATGHTGSSARVPKADRTAAYAAAIVPVERAVREQRSRLTPKASRDWPRRKPHKPPGAPQLLTINSIETTVKNVARHAA